ncbi:MAG: glycoside hydrolase family 3 protein [Mobilitalea sp.]
MKVKHSKIKKLKKLFYGLWISVFVVGITVILLSKYDFFRGEQGEKPNQEGQSGQANEEDDSPETPEGNENDNGGEITQEPDNTSSNNNTSGDISNPPDSQNNENHLEDIAQQILSDMSLRDKVSQMFIVFADSLTGVSNTTAAGETTRKALENYPVGGILFSANNLTSEQQVIDLIRGMQAYSNLPLFIASDEEGGRVARVMKSLQTYNLNPMFSYKDLGEQTAYDNAKLIAASISQYGFNLDFAPVADVWSNPANTVIGDRAYSDDYEQAAELVAAAVKGFQDSNIICTLKHFPGHGDTEEDSHYASAYVSKSLEELRKEEFLPFRKGIEAGADMVMLGHLILKEEEEVPVTFSYHLATEVLRDELKFTGVITTDALNMQAMTDHYGTSNIVKNAVNAGADILLCPADLSGAIDALEQAVNSGEITEERINQSVKRILMLKIKKGIIKE